jgi:hypothetical protein
VAGTEFTNMTPIFKLAREIMQAREQR